MLTTGNLEGTSGIVRAVYAKALGKEENMVTMRDSLKKASELRVDETKL